MKKEWRLMPLINKEFVGNFSNYSEIILQLLYNRDLTTKEDIEDFFQDDFERIIFDPFLFNDMEEAVKLIISTVKNQDKIVIYGDYDVDGVTSSALLKDLLELFKAKVEVYIPDRVDEGYGLNEEAIKQLAKEDTKLLITVDCGIRSKSEIQLAKDLNMDVIITDHHVPSDNINDLPECLIINPSLANDNYPYKYLAGVGVAYKLASALVDKSKLGSEEKELLKSRMLDLVAVGTVADCVTLLGENRILVKRGLEILNNTRRIGLKKILEVAQINNKYLDAWNIGFQIGPRINAAGRMEHANLAYQLLVSKDEKEAEALAKKVNDLNIDRQLVTEETMNLVEEQIEKDGIDNIIISVSSHDGEAWSEGITGLVAGRIADKYYRPVLIITQTEEGYKGSGRSIEEFNIIEAVETCSEYLERYGGHPAACGFSLKKENLEQFSKKMKEIAQDKIKPEELQAKINIEAEIDFYNINEDLLSEIQRFAPFGQNNPRPKFLSKNIQIKDVVTMGKNDEHIKFRFNGIWAISFGRAEDFSNYKVGDFVDMVYYIESNDFNGRSELQAKIIDIRYAL